MIFRTSIFRTSAVATLLASIVVLAAVVATRGYAQSSSMSWGPEWTADGQLILPEGFHDWTFLGSPLTPNALNGGAAAFPEFHNVYVHPEALAAYRDSGEWPEGTILLKELQLTRPSMGEDGSVIESSGRGYFPGMLNGIDISVKDSDRFADSNGWGFFNFGHHAPPYAETAAAAPIESCAACHIANATDMVFIKFYEPILNSDQD